MTEHDTDYTSDIAYVHGYCHELNPLRVALPLLSAGIAAPAIECACELGFGYGISLNMHAAGTATTWYGTDFNDAHAQFAQQLSRDAQSKTALYNERFAAFCSRDDLPDFDFVGMHGVWSWISDDNRRVLVDFLQRRLKPGGVLYVDYNTTPGWATMLPVRELMVRDFQARMTASTKASRTGDDALRVNVAATLAFVRDVFAAKPGYALVNPSTQTRIDALLNEDPHYVAHEYLTPDWQPTSFADVAGWFASAGLSYAGSAHYRDHIDELNLTAAQRTMLSTIDDLSLRETTRDICTNRSFRADYWIKASKENTQSHTLDAVTRDTLLREQRIVLAVPAPSVSLTARGALGEAALPANAYTPIVDALSDHRVKSLGALASLLEQRGVSMAFDTLVKRVMLLVGTGALMTAQSDAQIAAATPLAQRLNLALCERARHDGAVHYLVSPVSGSAIAMPREAQLFLLARAHHHVTPKAWADFAAATSGAPKASTDDSLNKTTLEQKAQRFADVYLPILRALGVVSD